MICAECGRDIRSLPCWYCGSDLVSTPEDLPPVVDYREVVL